MNLFRTALLLLILSGSAFAADTTSVRQKRFAIGITVSPDYCFRRLQVTAPNAVTDYIINYRTDAEAPMPAYTGGIDLSCQLKERFSSSLGINFSQKGFQATYNNLMDINGNTIGSVNFRYNYYYIGIPLKANFSFGKKKIHFITSAGLTPSFLLYEQGVSKVKYSNGDKSKSKDKPDYINNPFNLFLDAGLGADIRLGEKTGLQIMPDFSYGLLRTVNAPITEYLWNTGLNIRCYFRF
jgi:hypothetical protein